ncbi:hypothetical protein [Conexibacter sp. CPCC 206217]|uniref:hypothetical protein n=1 Tax=Conexibacter sp. CPCC 206217 TaxID=3064574 RepID=UPI00272701AA|nr:hypothetical protein [Conexibacter sp. CPCC 206217]MDO8212834.1 hypothetical protein [Conexibacter sp. CPCC 206217]
MSGSRQFARGDELLFSLGTPMSDAFAIAVVVKPSSATADQTWVCDRSTAGYVFGIDGGALAIFESGSRSANYTFDSSIMPRTGVFQVMMYAKSRGATAGVFSRIPLDGSRPVHVNADGGAYGDLRASVGWRIGKAGFSGYDFAGLIAAVALWSRYTGSAERNTFTSLTAIGAAAPLHLWDERDTFTFDRGSDAAANRTAITGTSHSTDEPTDFWPGTENVPAGSMVGVGDGKAVVFWTEVDPPADGYRVYRDGVRIYDGPGVGDRGTVAYEDTGLTNGVPHTWTVTSYDGAVESNPTLGMTATPIAPTVRTGGSREFDGTDLVRFLPGIEPQEQLSATFLLVVKPDSVTTAAELLRGDASPSQGDDGNPYVFRISDAGRSRYALTLDVWDPAHESTSWAETGITLAAGVWQMVAVSYFSPDATEPRFHHLNMATGIYRHVDGDPDHTYTIHPHGTWTVGDGFRGLIALAAVIETVDDVVFETLDLDAITALAHAQWDERDEFLGDHSGGDALALRNAITGTTHSTDEPVGFW